MTVLDRRGSTVNATDPATATDPNPGLAYKTAVRCATTANITLSGLQTLDGIVLAANDRVLVWFQTDQTKNGIYNASTGVWVRATDADSPTDFTAGLQVYVLNGTLYGSKTFTLTTIGTIVLGTTNLVFTQQTFPDSAIEFVIDGGGAVIITGDRIFQEIPFNCTVKRWTLLGSTANSIVIDLYKTSYTDFPAVASICGTDLPTLVAARKNQSTALTGWTTALSKGDILTAHVNSVTGLVLCTLSLLVTRS